MSMLEHHRDEADARSTRTKLELIASKRAVALGKLTEFKRQCARLAHFSAKGVIGRADAADALFEAAEANGLIAVHGCDYIEFCVASAFQINTLDPAAEGSAT
jgi:hypothetical protein